MTKTPAAIRAGVSLLALAALAACGHHSDAAKLDLSNAPKAKRGELAAFPGAEGAGRFALGGRGGQVLKVTNLEDAGPGSLRAAVEASGPRTIVFDVAGTIALKTPLRITNGQVTIAGQSAPGLGITLRDQPLIVAADDVVVRYIRSRLGDVSHAEEDAISVDGGHRIILDHVSASWSVDETLSASARYGKDGSGIYDLTVQWSIIAESLDHSVHSKGRHGYGSLIRGGEGSRFSWHHNLWADHQARVPRPGNYADGTKDPKGAFIDFRDNVFYNWGGDPQANQDATGWLKGTGRIDGKAAGYDADQSAHVTVNFVDNTYLPGPDSKSNLVLYEHNKLARTYLSGNSMAGSIPSDQHSLVAGDIPKGYWLSSPAAIAPVKTEAAAKAYERVLNDAGASLMRDPVDEHVVEEVRTNTGRIIDSQRQVGGWPAIAPAAAALDSDGDGIPDAWETANGLNPNDPSDGAKFASDGYTSLEHYLNSLVAAPAK